MSGRVGDLSPKQEAALQKFRENVADAVKPPFDDDHYLLRWLRARSFDLKKSEKMLRDSLEWRQKYSVDSLLTDYTMPEVIEKYHPGGLCGFDKEGRPFWIDTLGYADVKGLMYSARKVDLVRFKAYWSEKIIQLCFEQSEKLGCRIDSIGLIFDMEGIGMKHLWKPAVDVFIEVLQMFEANYPETLGYCYVINAPRIFPIAYNLVKPFLSEDTKKKIHVLGGSWKDKVQERIDPSELPVHWGGTQTGPDGDIYCKHKIGIGGTVPDKYLIQKTNFVDMSNFSSLTVSRGSSCQLDFTIEKPASVLRWQFLSEGNDIGFGVFRRTAASRQKATEMEEVVASDRVNSHIVPEDGSLTCDVPGTYVLRFDNTYSWVKNKKVQYLVEVLEPGKMENGCATSTAL